MEKDQPEEYYKKLLLLNKVKPTLRQEHKCYIFNQRYCWDILFKDEEAPNLCFNYVKKVLKGPFPKGEEYMAKSYFLYSAYIFDYKRKPDKNFEKIITDNENNIIYRNSNIMTEAMIRYSLEIKKDITIEFHRILKRLSGIHTKYVAQYVEAFYEKIKIVDPDLLENYEKCLYFRSPFVVTEYIVKHKQTRIPEFERIILKHPATINLYAKKIIRGRWAEGEKQLLKNKTAKFLYVYAKKVIKGRWKEAEELIFKSPEIAYFYVKYVYRYDFEEVKKVVKGTKFMIPYQELFAEKNKELRIES